MALPSSGAITMAMVAAEIGISASGLSLNDSRVRQLAGKPSGAISFADLRGKAWLLPPTIWEASRTWVEQGRDWCGPVATGQRVTLGIGGGAAGAVSATKLSGSSIISLRQLSNTVWEVWCTVSGGASGSGTWRFSVSNASGTASVNITLSANTSSCSAG